MSVHIIKKGIDKRFVDALVTTERWFTPDYEEYEDEYNGIYFQRNHDRKKWRKDYTNSKWIVHAFPQWYIDNSTNWLCDYIEHLFATIINKNYCSIAIPIDISPDYPVSISDMYHAISMYAPEDMLVYIITEQAGDITKNQLYLKINQFIDSKFTATVKQSSIFAKKEAKNSLNIQNWFEDTKRVSDSEDDDYLNDVIAILKRNSGKVKTDKAQSVSLEEYVAEEKDGFAETLFALIDEKGVNEVDCYKRANVNRRTFSKIRTDRAYHPSKKTVFAFAVSLKLTYEETETLLKSAGYTFSNSNKMDLIVEYFILNGNYDIFEINEALFAFDQPLLGM